MISRSLLLSPDGAVVILLFEAQILKTPLLLVHVLPLPAVSAFPTLTPSVSAKEVAMSGWKTLFREEELVVAPPP